MLHYGVTDVPPEERYAQATVDQALDFLQGKDGDQPWLSCVSFSEPNEALVVSRETFERYDLADIDLPANRDDALPVNEGEVDEYDRFFIDKGTEG